MLDVSFKYEFYKMGNNLLKIAMAQIAPVWLDKGKKHLEKIESSILDAC